MSAEPLPSVLALGAWLKNTACLLDAGVSTLSAPHGDLGDPQARTALEASASDLLARARQPVRAIAHDLHPDFFSTRLAQQWAHERGIAAIGVQHHHAHIAAVMAEHGLRAPVVGIALDGFGLGDDGQAWGGELLWVAPSAWRRLGALWPLGLPGGDQAAREPWRMAAAALCALGRGEEIPSRFESEIGLSRTEFVRKMLSNKDQSIRCPETSSAGRWFDAAAAALGLCLRQSDEAQAAMALEQAARQWLQQHPAPRDVDAAVCTPEPTGLVRLDLRPLLARLLDTPAGRQGEAAAWFHLALAEGLARWAGDAAASTGVGTVCLGGGCFHNRVLTAALTQRLQKRGLQVWLPDAFSCGDAGLALGQAWVAAHALASEQTKPTSRESSPCV